MDRGLVFIGCPSDMDVEALTHDVLCRADCPFRRTDIRTPYCVTTLGGRTDLVFIFKEGDILNHQAVDAWRYAVGGCMWYGEYIMSSHYDRCEEQQFATFLKVRRSGANLALPATRQKMGLTLRQYGHILVNFKALSRKYRNEFIKN